MFSTKLKYLLQSLGKIAANKKDYCPYCSTLIDKKAEVVDRKAYFIRLIKCPSCYLLIRTPTDTVQESKAFYQEEYSQGYTTDCPGDKELQELLSTSFKNSERDYSKYISLFQAIGIKPGDKILDYGCSWGYGTYQIGRAGFDVMGYEISKPRLQYGVDKLGIRGVADVEAITKGFDVFFSSHVLEHVPDLKYVFDVAQKLLKPGGYFIAVTPNGSEVFRKSKPFNFHHLWGKVHPILLTDEFVLKNFNDKLKVLGSFPPVKELSHMNNEKQIETADKWELLFVFQTQSS